MMDEGRVPFAAGDAEVLGEVTAPTGTLLVLDMGLLDLWPHDRPPTVPEGLLPDDVTAAANSAVDLAIAGPDAERAGLAYDRQWHPRYLFDIPAQAVDQQRAHFDSIICEHGLDARLVALGERVPHRRRVDLALEQG